MNTDLLNRLKDWYLEWPDPRIRKHGKFESEALWIAANEHFKIFAEAGPINEIPKREYSPPRYEDDPVQGAKILDDMAATYRERNSLYKANYLKVGKILAILYPDGVHLKTPEDFTRWHFIDWMIGKLSRFSVNHHPDSIHDLAVYAAMIEGWLKHERKEGGGINEAPNL